jgi:lysozyme
MKISSDGLNLIKKAEGFSPVIYKCSSGYDTIGYGHRVLPGERFATITKEQAQELLIKDSQVAQDCVNNAVKVPLSQSQFDALVSLVYNIGVMRSLNPPCLKN